MSVGRLVRTLVAVVVALAAVVGLGACSSHGDAAAVPAGAVVIDVRTGAEYAAGHLKGAVNIDVEDPGFAARVGQLPKEGHYLVYCRTGNRAGAAKAQMGAMGFTDVTNLGGVDAASKTTHLAVVTD